MAMSASGERNPNAMRVSSRILVLTDSIRALDRPWSRVFQMRSRWRRMLRARATNSEMRECDAHDSHPASSWRPRVPLTP